MGKKRFSCPNENTTTKEQSIKEISLNDPPLIGPTQSLRKEVNSKIISTFSPIIKLGITKI